MPPRPTHRLSQSYHRHRQAIEEKYRTKTSRALATAHDLFPHSTSDYWVAGSLQQGMCRSLGRIQDQREAELEALLAAELGEYPFLFSLWLASAWWC